MALPASFARDGFGPITRPRFRRLMIGTEGAANTGKTEFILSAPGPGIVTCLDRGYAAMLDNPNPPPTRRNDYAFKIIDAPMQGSEKQDVYQQYWVSFRDTVYRACANPDARTVGLDGDSDSWELQRLAAFGKLTQIPSILYTGVNAARRLFISRLHDSGKIVIATNKLKKEYKAVYKPDGTPELDDAGRIKRTWDGKSYDRQGFEDHEYLWQIQLRHLYDEDTKQFGIRILRAKANMDLEGAELWGAECCFEALVANVYPHIKASEWGL